MFLTIAVIFSLILHGKDMARTLFLQEELPALGIWTAGCKALLFTPNLERFVVPPPQTPSRATGDASTSPGTCPSLSPLGEPEALHSCAAKSLFCLSHCRFSRGSETQTANQNSFLQGFRTNLNTICWHQRN